MKYSKLAVSVTDEECSCTATDEKCSDSGVLQITIINAIDMFPEIVSDTIYIYENSSIGTLAYTVIATDDDLIIGDSLTYRITHISFSHEEFATMFMQVF